MKTEHMLIDYIKIADITAAKLKDALGQTKGIMPISPDDLSKLSLTQTALLDMITMRFGKLQDIIGAKIFPLILEILKEDAKTFIDKLHKLEKLYYLDDANWWIDIRDLRNQVAHEYPDDDEAICKNIAALAKESNALVKFWQELKEKVVKLLES